MDCLGKTGELSGNGPAAMVCELSMPDGYRHSAEKAVKKFNQARVNGGSNYDSIPREGHERAANADP